MRLLFVIIFFVFTSQIFAQNCDSVYITEYEKDDSIHYLHKLYNAKGQLVYEKDFHYSCGCFNEHFIENKYLYDSLGNLVGKINEEDMFRNESTFVYFNSKLSKLFIKYFEKRDTVWGKYSTVIEYTYNGDNLSEVTDFWILVSNNTKIINQRNLKYYEKDKLVCDSIFKYIKDPEGNTSINASVDSYSYFDWGYVKKSTESEMIITDTFKTDSKGRVLFYNAKDNFNVCNSSMVNIYDTFSGEISKSIIEGITLDEKRRIVRVYSYR